MGNTELKEFSESLIGKNIDIVEYLCRTKNVNYRFIEIDGEPSIITMDLKFDRLNFVVENNLVVKYELF